ncbi:hypothetical protein LWI28_018191 [Acer negundo]|uniref:Bifunctional inhibitor/plant lipid transfer protein/seed storage helical domain-containing protein n=1 Tax=Acer negundo TaxID=4023 RepID=A0AAD5IS51_ACENE|nr:hypothetical protein LWI28_018191 [Acer negundo]
MDSIPQEETLVVVAGGNSMSCVTKLLPCKPYLKASSLPPPATCCIPLNEAVTKEAECLCNVLHNPEIMKSFNVTLDDALSVAKALWCKC